MTGAQVSVAESAVAILTALSVDEDQFATDLICELDFSSAAAMALIFGGVILKGWRDLAIAIDEDPDAYVADLLALLGQGVAT